MTRIIGPPRSRRRRWTFLWALVVLLGVGMVFISGAQAVHNTGAFELDGNATSNSFDDWDRVCHQKTGSASCGTTADTSGGGGATAVEWTGDCPVGSSGIGCGNLNATIFTGGGSKDPQNIDQWAWKDGAGGLPDKDNLLHSFAARYSLTATTAGGTCPNGTDAGGNAFDPTKKCEVLYFGSDRYDNSGDAQQGFWFLQNKIGLGSNAVGGGSGFTSSGSGSTQWHRNGDLLVISDFSNGGTTATITVYKWDSSCTKAVTKPAPGDCGDVNLRLLATSDNAKCATGLSDNDPFCGIVNPSNGTTVPWSSDYTDKSGNNSYLQGELYEGGINLSLLGLSNECFSSVVSETRSSTSTTATLKDFVLGNFAVCDAHVTTSPSAGVTEATSVSPGTPVTDTATVTGTGLSSPPDPTGNVTFFMCGPTATSSTTTCSSGGTQVGNPVALDGGANTTDGIATATSAQVNTSGSPLTPGRYCFRAEWPGDSNYQNGPYADGPYTTATANTECFVVRQIPTSTVTTPSDSSGTALSGSQALGTTLYDLAVVTGTAAGGTPTGTVSFYVCNPTQVTGAAGSEVCASGNGTQVGSDVTLQAVANSTPPKASALSAGTVASTAGVWCFRATYNPSGSTYLSSNDTGSHSECVTVNPESTTTETTPRDGQGNAVTTVSLNSSVFDYAKVTGTAAGGTPTGTVSFFVCNPSQVTGAAGSEVCGSGAGSAVTGNPKTLVAISGSSPPAADTTSGAVTANLLGVWCFRATFTPSGTNAANYTGSSDGRHSECFTVTTTSSGTSAQNWLPNDSVTVSTAGGVALNGSLVITLRTDSCTGTVVYTEPTKTLSGTGSGTTFNTTNTSFTVSTASNKDYYWRAVFTSSDPFVSGFTKCEKTNITIDNNP